jgi:hypothetical protein
VRYTERKVLKGRGPRRAKQCLFRHEIQYAGQLTAVVRQHGCTLFPIHTSNLRSLGCQLPTGEELTLSPGTLDEIDQLLEVCRRLGVEPPKRQMV